MSKFISIFKNLNQSTKLKFTIVLRQLFVVETSKANANKNNQNNDKILFSFKNGVKILFATKTSVTLDFNNTNSNFQLLIQIDDNKSFISNINNFKNIGKISLAQKDRNNKNLNSQLRLNSTYVTLNIDF